MESNRLARAEIKYARNGGVALAFQVVGDGDVDLVYVPDWVSNLVYGWEYPPWRDFYLHLARSFRLILFDKRGTGLSDHGGQFATLETRMEDLRAVLDAAGSSNPVILSGYEGTGMAVMFAASYPERTRALVLFHAIAKGEGIESESRQQELADLREGWGVQEWCDELLRDGCPSLAGSEDHRRWFANWLRVGASPAVAYALNRAFNETDLRDVLPAVRVPTLLLYRSLYEADTMDVASRIPNARTMRVSGSDYLEIFLSPDIVEEIERFVAGEEAPSVPESVLATVMFTDIVNSTDHAARIGDRAWRDLLARHHAIVRRELSRYRGHERDTAGDGFFATFDGPARAIGAAQAITNGVRTLGLEARIGIHVGECELHDDKIAGLAVNIGSRVAANAGASEVLVSQTVRDLVAGSGISFGDRGIHELKGIPGSWQLFAVADTDN
ncbi:MAG TPA: adenylate/guanylate cyclase domain-containing protein [Gaiellaceae bacterium]|jgi:class 3 adenylate cyclase